MQVQAIDPVIAPNGQVTIRMRVTGARDRAVELVHNLERSRHFAAPRLIAEALANQNSGGQVRTVSTEGANPADVTFDILADYRPLPHSHPSTPASRGRSAKAVPGIPAAPEAAPQAQLTNPDPVPAPAKPAVPNMHWHRAPPVATNGLPAIPPPIGAQQ